MDGQALRPLRLEWVAAAPGEEKLATHRRGVLSGITQCDRGCIEQRAYLSHSGERGELTQRELPGRELRRGRFNEKVIPPLRPSSNINKDIMNRCVGGDDTQNSQVYIELSIKKR